MIIPIAEPMLGSKELENVQECVKSGWLTYRGNYVKEFEECMAGYVGTRYAVATSSCTAAMHLSMLALGVKPGDEVIVPVLTFIATANAVVHAGGTPIFADVDPYYWCISPEEVERRITKRTVGILPVHLYGHPCDMSRLLSLADRYGLWVVDDCAESQGALYMGRRVGGFSHVGCFCFFANKVITTGEGGMCLTDSEELAKSIRVLSDHGTIPGKPYIHDRVGYNYRMTNLQAALGVAQIGRIEELLLLREQVAEWYDMYLPREVSRRENQCWATPINWQYTVLFSSEEVKKRVARNLADTGIETRPMFYPITSMAPYKSRRRFPIAEDLSRRGLSLPSSPKLKLEEVKFVCNMIKEALVNGQASL